MALLLKKSAPAEAPKKPALVAKKSAAPVAKKSSLAPKARPVEDDADEGDGGTPSKGKGGIGVSSGWGGADKLKSEVSTFANTLRLKANDEFYIRFLEDEPYANVKTHWLERKGKKSFICLGKGCPLCDSGHDVRVTFAFNVVKITEDEPLLFSWEVGTRILETIRGLAAGSKTKPLSSKWYALKRTGSKMNDTVYSLTVVKRVSDIEDDDDTLHVPTDEEIQNLFDNRYTLADIEKQVPSKKELRDVAEETDEDDDDDD